MKNNLKSNKWLRWITASVFGLMLVLNIMVSLEFEKGKFLPSITLTELGNMAMAQGEDGPIYESCENNEIAYSIYHATRKFCFNLNAFVYYEECESHSSQCCPGLELAPEPSC